MMDGIKTSSALRNAVVSIIFFGYATCLSIAIFIYAVVIMVGCFVVAGLAVTAIFTVISLLFHFENPPPVQDMAMLGIIVMLIASPIMAGLVFIYFLLAPISIRRKLKFFITTNSYYDEDLRIQEIITRIAQVVAATMKVRHFNAIVLTRSSTAATLEIGHWRVLFVDPFLVTLLNEREISAIIAHEFGHLDNNINFSYSYVRRCTVIEKCLEFEANPNNKSLFHYMVNIITLPVGIPFIRSVYRYGYYRIIKFVHFGIHLFTINIGKFLSPDFHAAEFRADANAAIYYSDALASALLKLLAFKILQKLDFQTSHQNNIQLLHKKIQSIYNTSLVTHPSPKDRLSRLPCSDPGTPTDYELQLLEATSEIIHRFSADGQLNLPARSALQSGDGGEQLFLSMAMHSEPELTFILENSSRKV